MATRCTYQQDKFLHAYFESIGPSIGPHDLGRSEKATIARVDFLKSCGAWDYIAAEKRANDAYHAAIGIKSFSGTIGGQD